MKAATGELNLTVITVVAIVAVMGIFYMLFPQIKQMIDNQWSAIDDPKSAKDEADKITDNYIVLDGYDVTIK